MANTRNLAWKLRRYVFRRDFFHKLSARFRGYRRRAEKDEFTDLAFVYAGLDLPQVIFDVGANIGLVSSKLRKLFPAATVYAFEPTRETAQTLLQRLSADQQVIINQVAVSDLVGSATFRVDNRTHGGGSNSLLEHSDNFATRARVDRYESVIVETTTLDSYVKKNGISRIDILKLDIEGAEVLALKGGAELLRDQKIYFIVTEMRFIEDYRGQPLMADLLAYLEPLEYTIFNIYNSAESSVRQALFGNMVFVSNAMRGRLLARYGQGACGWHDGDGAAKHAAAPN